MKQLKLFFKQAFLFFGVLLIYNKIFAQAPQRIISLEQAVLLAQQHNKQLQIDSLNLQLAQSKITQGRQSLLPQVSANISYLRISDNITPFKVSFPTGDVVLNPQILNQSYNNVQARQLIYAGGKIKESNRILELEKKVLYFDIEKTKADAAYSVTALWYNLFTLKQARKIIEANIAAIKSQRQDAANYVGQGILLENEVLKLDLAITNFETNLADIISNQKTVVYNLCLLTGIDVNEQIDIPDALPAVETINISLPDAIAKAVSSRPELKQFSLRKEQGNAALKIAKGYYLPTLSTGGSYNYDQPNQRLFPNQSVFTGTWNIGLFLSWNLTDLYTTKEKVKEGKIAINKINAAYELATEGIQMEVNADYNHYIQTKQKIAIAKKALEQAQENFRVEKNKFTANTATATDFLNANALLLQAELNLSAAKANADLAYKKLLKSIN
jgi:outer membrane protein